MISYPLYKVVHLAGVLFLFTAFGGLILHAINGGDRESNSARKLTAVTHGLALVFILISGFGLIARLGYGHDGAWPMWIWLKVAIWLALGGALVAIKKAPDHGRLLWLIIPLLGIVAAFLAVYKPGGTSDPFAGG